MVTGGGGVWGGGGVMGTYNSTCGDGGGGVVGTYNSTCGNGGGGVPKSVYVVTGESWPPIRVQASAITLCRCNISANFCRFGV